MSVLAQLRLLPRAAWILFLGTFVNRFGSFVMPFLAIYLTRDGFSATQAVAVSAYGAGHIFASMIGGYLADRIGRRYTITLSMFGSAVMMLALSQARAYPVILVCTFFVSLVGELYRPAATALLGDLVAPEQRVIAFGMYRFAVNLGFALGPATAGLLANRSFFFLFAGDAATSLVYGIVAFTALPHGIRSGSSSEKTTGALRIAFADRAFMLFLAASLCVTCVEFQLHSTVPLYITHLGYTPATYGLLMSINGVMIVTLELILISWTQGLPRRALIALGYALTAIGIGLTGFVTKVPALAATVVVWTAGEMVFAPVTGAFVTDLAPEKYRGRYMGLWHSTWSAGMLLGPTIGTLVYAHNPLALWIGCFVMGVFAAWFALAR